MVNGPEERIKNGSVRTTLVPRTPTKGRMKQCMADAPLRERGPSTAFMLQEPEGSGWSFSEKQFLTLARLQDVDA